MNFDQLLKSLPTGSWSDKPQLLTQYQSSLKLSDEEFKSLRKSVIYSLDKGDSVSAANYLYAGLILDEERFLADLQKKGTLRISRFSYAAEPLAPTVGTLLKPGLGLSKKVEEYLQSVFALYEIAKSVHKEYLAIRRWLDEERESAIKSALACLDFLFLKSTMGLHVDNSRVVKFSRKDIFFFSVEELAEGFSTLLATYGIEFGPLQDNVGINRESCESGLCFGYLISGSHISIFRAWEFQVDRLGYRISQMNDAEEYLLSPPSTEFHQAYELGFIQTNQQRAIKTIESLDKSAKSFEEIAPTIARKMKESGLIRRIEKPAERIRFDFPGELIVKAAAINGLMLEERVALLWAGRELFTPADELLDFELEPDFSLRDLFVASRVFQFIRCVVASSLMPELGSSPGLVLQSLIPVFRREALVELLAAVVGKDSAEKTVELFLTDVNGHVDIQYRPLIPVGDNELFLPANVFVGSSFYRNPFVVVRKRIYEDGKDDPLSKLLDAKFKERGCDSRVSVSYNAGEVDVLTLKDGILFALECKNTLVPTGPHELMTTWDYIQKAAVQLDRFITRFSDLNFREQLAKETGLAIDETTRLCTGIVVSNRMLMGLRLNGHPVRGAYETEHFIDQGTIAMGDESHDYWAGDEFSGQDFQRFLEDDITYIPQWKCMEPFELVYQFSDCAVHVPRLNLNLLHVADHFGFAKAKEGLLAQQTRFDKFVDEYSVLDDFKTRADRERKKSRRKEKKRREKALTRISHTV